MLSRLPSTGLCDGVTTPHLEQQSSSDKAILVPSISSAVNSSRVNKEGFIEGFLMKVVLTGDEMMIRGFLT